MAGVTGGDYFDPALLFANTLELFPKLLKFLQAGLSNRPIGSSRLESTNGRAAAMMMLFGGPSSSPSSDFAGSSDALVQPFVSFLASVATGR